MDLIPWNQVKVEVMKLLVKGILRHLSQIGRLSAHYLLVLCLYITLL
jgi:hypothetical protein